MQFCPTRRRTQTCRKVRMMQRRPFGNERISAPKTLPDRAAPGMSYRYYSFLTSLSCISLLTASNTSSKTWTLPDTIECSMIVLCHESRIRSSSRYCWQDIARGDVQPRDLMANSFACKLSFVDKTVCIIVRSTEMKRVLTRISDNTALFRNTGTTSSCTKNLLFFLLVLR